MSATPVSQMFITSLYVARVHHLQAPTNITSTLFFQFFYYNTDLLCGTVYKKALKTSTLHVQRKCTKLIPDFLKGSTPIIKTSVKKKKKFCNK